MWRWSKLPTLGTHWLLNCPWKSSKQCANWDSCAETGPLMEIQKWSLEKHFKCFLLDSVSTFWFECEMPPRDMCVKTWSPVAGTVLGTVMETLELGLVLHGSGPGWHLYLALFNASWSIWLPLKELCLVWPSKSCSAMSPALQGVYPLWSHEPEINFPPLNMPLSGILSQQQEKPRVQQERVS